MQHLSYIYGIFFILFLWSCQPASQSETVTSDIPSIIPKPVSLTPATGKVTLTTETPIYTDPAFEELAIYLTETLSPYFTKQLQPATTNPDATPDHALIIQKDESITHPEGYKLTIEGRRVRLLASQTQGVFYAIQTLRQLFPTNALHSPQSEISLPFVTVVDSPRYSYRGMHLDVSRHFFPVDFIKKYIDLLALHKFNVFHWHLTDDQGWRIEIKQYPKLTEVGAYREQTLVGHYRDQPHQFDGTRYGGFYTQEEVKDIVAYARARHITVIPEIEMPGHARAALAAYPELACTPGPFKVAEKWGIFEDIFCPTEETFTFLENVLLEVMELFPSEYIHIGGDEAPKVRWEESPEAQAVMKRENLSDAFELQSYFIQRIEKFVNANGKRIIGWDEILEGGLAPNATVMSWRGMEGGIEAARQGHDVIMTPTSHTYFDYYQSDPAQEPLAIGGMLTLEKVYALEPTPEELTEAESQHILGAQANLWTEYIPTPDKVEYMIFPRACALAEVVWSPQAARDYKDFTARLASHISSLQAMDVNVATTLYNVSAEVNPDTSQHEIGVALKCLAPGEDWDIRYTLDGTAPQPTSDRYETPIIPRSDVVIRAATFRDAEQLGNIFQLPLQIHLANARPVSLRHPPSEKYNAGPYVLTDGVRGTEIFNDLWYGFDGEDMVATIDLGESVAIDSIQIGALHTPYAWIFYPSKVTFAISEEGEAYQIVEEVSDHSALESSTPVGKKMYYTDVTNLTARFIRITAANTAIPSWHSGSGKGSWLFVDEIVVK